MVAINSAPTSSRERIADALGDGPEQRRETRQRRAAHHRRAHKRRRQRRDADKSERAQPAGDAERFNRHIGDRPADQRAAGDRIRRHRQPKRGRRVAARRRKPRRTRSAQTKFRPPPAPSNADDWRPPAPKRISACACASSSRPQWPPTVPSSARFHGSSKASITLTRKFSRLRQRQHVLDHARLVRRRRQRALAHAPRARPADLADDHFFAGKGGHHAAADRIHMGGGIARRESESPPNRAGYGW